MMLVGGWLMWATVILGILIMLAVVVITTRKLDIIPHVHNWDKARVSVQGRTWVVTGATSGIGRGVAERAGRLGARVVIAARRPEALEDVAKTIRSYGGEALVVPTDVTDPKAVENLAEMAERTFGKVDVWLNIAGVAPIGHFQDIPVADISRTVDTNVKGVMYGSQIAIRRFCAQGYGTLVNMASVEGRVPLAYHAYYAATKGAIITMNEALREEMRQRGFNRIKVISIEPWGVDTPFWANGANYTGRELRCPWMDYAQPVADSTVWAAVNTPSGELPVGPKASVAVLASWIAPYLSARLAGMIIHRLQYGQPLPPAPPTSGNLHVPSPAAPTIEGGRKRPIKK